MKYAVVELKYMMKKTFIVPIIYVDDYVSDFTPTMEFYCYISTNLKDEPKFDAKYCTKFNGSPGLFKVFILVVKDSIEDAINFQELNRIKSVSIKFRQSANTDAELKCKAAKGKKREKIAQKAAQKNANVKNSAYLAKLLTANESDTSELSEDSDETMCASGAKKLIMENAQNSQKSQISKDFAELGAPNSKRMKKEVTAKKSVGITMKEDNTVHSVQKLAGTKTLQITKSLADDAINYQEQTRKRSVSGKSIKANNKDGDLRKAKRKKTEETNQRVVEKNTEGNKAQKLTATKISATSDLSNSVSISENGDIEKSTITETKTDTVKVTLDNQKQGIETPLPKNGEGNFKSKKPNQVKEKGIYTEVSGISDSITLISNSCNEVENGNTDYSPFCDESYIELPDEIFGDLLGTNPETFPSLMNEDTHVRNVEAINKKDIAVEEDTIVPSVDTTLTKDLLQNIEPGEGLTYSVDENGTLTLIPTVKESIHNAVNNEVNNLPVTIASTSSVSNCIQNHTGNVSSSSAIIDSEYKEAYLELEKKHNDLSDRHLGLQYALSLAAKVAQSEPTVQVPFTEKHLYTLSKTKIPNLRISKALQNLFKSKLKMVFTRDIDGYQECYLRMDGGRLYNCGVFIDASQCKFIDKSKDHQQFVNNVALAVFTRKTLAVSSVTGTVCKNYKYAADGLAKTPLDEAKLKLVYDLVAARTNNDKDFNSVRVNKLIGKKIANIVGADKAKATRILAKQNKEQQL